MIECPMCDRGFTEKDSVCAACDGEGWIVPGALAGYLEDLVAAVEDKSGADLDVMAVLIHKIAGVSNPADLQELVRQHLAAKGIKARPTLPDHPEPPSTAAETPDPVEPAAEEPDLEPPALAACPRNTVGELLGV